MNNRIVVILLLFFYLFSLNVFSENKKTDVIWMYEKVSNTDVFDKHDASVTNSLDSIYGKVTINTGEKKLNIRNDFLENNHVCSIDYVKVETTPLSYFLSQKTVNMYEKLFTREGIHLSKTLSILESVFPEKSCPPPYDEIIRNDDRLMILDQNRVIFFKEMNPVSNTAVENSQKENLLTYCHNAKAGHVYDGTSKYICNFSGVNLKDTYSKIWMLNNFSHKYMKEDLPIKNDEYKINGRTVSYQWAGDKLLNISVTMDGEITKYSFEEQSSGTKLEILGEAQY